MKFYRWLTISMVLCCTQIMWAQNCDQCYSGDACNSYSCESCCFDTGMQYSLYVDYLYWKPFRSGILRTFDGEDLGGDLFLDPSYTSGYRVGGRMYCNCVDLDVRYTSFDSISKDSSITFPEGPALSTVKYDVDFQALDI